MQKNNLAVYASPIAFSNKRVKVAAPLGSTIQEIVDLMCIDAPKDIGAIVFINDHIIPKQHWPRIKPKLGTIINVRVIPQGGGGKKNPLASLLSIAVMIAAPYVGVAFGTSLGLGIMGTGVLTAGQTMFFNGLVSGLVGIVGKLLISAIAPPPKPSNRGSLGNPAESPTQFIEGAKNSLNPYGVVPICLGTNRMFPLQAARPFTETKDNDQYVRQLFTYGWGKVVLDELKFGETDIDEFDSIDIEHRLEGDLHESTSLFSNDVFQDDYNILLQQVDGFTVRTTQPDVDAAIIDFTFPRGLGQFNSQAERKSYNVQLELQYALSGDSPQVWTPAASSFKAISSAALPIALVKELGNNLVFNGTTYNYESYRRDIVVIDLYSGVSRIVEGPTARTPTLATAPVVPTNAIRLSTILSKRNRAKTSGAVTNSIISYTDDRQSSLIGTNFQNAGDFLVSVAGTTATVAAGGLSVNQLDLTASQTEAFRKSVEVVFPANGTYDIRFRRISADTESDQIFDKAYVTAIKSIKYTAPVELEGISGTAIKIKATDQLNGAIDQFNAVVSLIIPDWDAGSETWVERVTSNPASLYRYVLQGAANAQPLPDSKIDIEALQEWHEYCELQGFSYNRVIDYDTSVADVLQDVASAGAASPAIVDGKRTIVVDRLKDDIVQLITPRNSWGYSGEMEYPDMPHAFRVQFRNKFKGYAQDERIVYADGYSQFGEVPGTVAATKFELLEYQSTTDPDLAYLHARRLLASAALRPETHSFFMDVENLVALRGDRIKFGHDVPIITIGDGRIKEITTNGDGLVTNILLDDVITIPSLSTYYIRIRLSDGAQLYKKLTGVMVGDTYNLVPEEPFDPDIMAEGDLCYVVEAGGELDLIILRIEPQDDLIAKITGINYAPEIFTAESGTIPPFESNITTPLEFIRPSKPILNNIQSDEDVMLRNSDGTITPRAIITLENPNEGNIETTVRIRRTGDIVFTNANVLGATPKRLILTGLDDGFYYDIHIRYRRTNSSLYSLPLEINGYLFVGASGVPDDIAGFLVNIADNNAFFKWDASTAIDHSHYVIKYSRVFTGATWGTAQLLEDNIQENRLTIPFQPGTYLIKDVDLSGNESENATAIITFDPGVIANAVVVIDEDPAFAGTKDNTVKVGDVLVLGSTDDDGYYYFDNDVDLGGIFTSFVSAAIVANGTFINDIFEIDDMFAEDDIFGSGQNDIFAMADMFTEPDIFGIGADAWEVQLEYRTTNDDPTGTPVWSDWTVFTAGNIEFWGIQFRLRLRSLSEGISPEVSILSVTVDMPDRIERGEDLVCPVEGDIITYDPPFKANPSVVITIQDGDANDELQFVSKTSSGFEFKIYNTTTAGYVERTYDFIASGYGRERV